MKLLLPLISRSVFMYKTNDGVYTTQEYGFTMGHALYKNFSNYLSIKHKGDDKLVLMGSERFSVFDLSFIPFMVIMPKENDFDIVEIDDKKLYCTKDFKDETIDPVRKMMKEMRND